MPKIHSGITDQAEIHTPKGFVEADNDTALIKNNTGTLEYRDLSELGGTGPEGPVGPSMQEWVTATEYVIGDVIYSLAADNTIQKIYRCAVSHTSGASLLSDLANWTELSPDIGVDPALAMPLSTSLLSGCELTVNAGDNSKFDMAAGVGIHVDNTTFPGQPIVTPVSVEAQVGVTIGNIGSQPSTSIAIDVSGNIVQRAAGGTPTQRRNTFDVGSLIHSDFATIVSVVTTWVPGYDIHAQLSDLMGALGFFITSGNEVSGVTGTLSIQKEAGTGFSAGINIMSNPQDPNTVDLPLQNPVDFFEVKQDNVVIGTDTLLDPTTYDNAGVITTVPANNDATIQYIYLFADGTIGILKGQEYFENLSQAIDAAGSEVFTVPSILESAILLARIVMRKDSSDTLDGTEVRIIPSGVAAAGGTPTVHTTMQQSYDTSVAPQVILDVGTGGIQYRDAATPIGSPLLEVQNNAGDKDYLSVEVGALKTETQAYSDMNTLVDGANISTDCSEGNVHEVILAGDRVLDNPSNLKPGATYLWIITQDVTGTRLLTYGSEFKFPGGDTPVLSTAAGSVDILSGVSDGTSIYCNLVGDFQ